MKTTDREKHPHLQCYGIYFKEIMTILILALLIINLMIMTLLIMLHFTRMERLARDKHSSVLGQFVSKEENGVFIKRVLTHVFTPVVYFINILGL